MAREKLKDFLNSKGFSADKISYNNEKVNNEIARGVSDLSTDPNTGEPLLDLDDHVNGLLGDYVAYIMEESNNVYTVKGSNTKSTNHDRGKTVTGIQEDNMQGANKAYASDSESVKNLNSYSNSGYIENLNEIIDKTSNNSHNHDLLKAEGKDLDQTGSTLSRNEESENIVIKSINNVLSKNNRFANVNRKTAFAPKGINESEFNKRDNNEGTYTSQQNFGRHLKDNPKNSFENLRKIGLSLLYKSTGYSSGDRKNTQKVDAVSDQIKNNGLRSSSYDNLGNFIKVPNSDLRSLNADGAPINPAGEAFITDPELISREKSKNSESFGSTYNTDVRFEGTGALHAVRAKLSLVAFKKIISTFYESVSDYITITDAGSEPADYFKIVNVLASTRYKYSDCVDRGFDIFFGGVSNDEIFKNYRLKDSPGYALAVCNSITKKQIETNYAINLIEQSQEDAIEYFKNLVNNKMFRLLNVLAIIGDSSLKSTEGFSIQEFISAGQPRARDGDTHSSEVAGGAALGNIISQNRKKSRRKNKGQLAWAQNETPSMYLLPANIIRASNFLDQGVFSPNPFTGMLGSEIAENTYFGVNADKTASRIPQEVVKSLEDKLDAEYVPFYVQDLRTNEIISFHAFLSNLNDTFSTQFNPTTGYGRMDPVQMFNTTSRNVSVTFTLVATSKEDFNSMWYKINKITTLFYPQWTQGTKVVDERNTDSVFVQPFSQVLGASPIVRLRVGDVIKSNYSKFNLSRVFGIGDPNVTPKPSESSELQSLFNAIDYNAPVTTSIREATTKLLIMALGSPTQFLNAFNANDIPSNDYISKSLSKGAFSATKGVISNFLLNGFVNPLIRRLITNALIDPNDAVALGSSNSDDFGHRKSILPIKLKANFNKGYNLIKDNSVVDSVVLTKAALDVTIKRRRVRNDRIMYHVIIVDTDSDIIGEEIICDHGDLIADPDFLFGSSIFGAGGLKGLSSLGQLATNPGALANNAVNGLLAGADKLLKTGGTPFTGAEQFLRDAYLANDESKFMTAENNPYVRAYETTMGRGLAGALSGLQFTWLTDEFTWETDYNSRAPIGVKMTFNLAVIHDIPPGLDHAGYNRAPLYNVGDIMGKISGDQYDDHGQIAKSNFKKQRSNKKIR